ncbi:MAG: sugar nucleotide-binding protein [Bacteroidia bacterium]|nr:sugar nucleotide-binding protein [Bacteroidia bacterium]
MLVTGGSGLLGTALKKIFPHAIFPSEEEFNLTDYTQMETYLKGKLVDTIIHGGAFTSPPKIDLDPIKAIEINIIGTSNMVKLASESNALLIYICTDYVFKGDKGDYKEEDPVFPVNKYAWSKLGGECAVRLYDKSLIIRTSFGPDIFPYEKAFTDQWTSRESVTKIAAMIAELIKMEKTGVVHVGGKRKSVYDYATYLDPSKEIGKISIKDISFKVPVDTSLNIELYEKLITK